ncbi:zinc metallohydrolase glyoxalase II family protein [Litorimonas cladophorae]|uniref:Zinc metallohydrolase glyoxalase II family protein n=1 Tax=Litorimonas cladophorae TaxID=1220491 RepID=A0A918KSK0_9PROT|nr:MBL fold metallo-hydrolase [Litorimonas cladophorae]GGX74460.1 zinc metallohydrolase glyoxalase II family protein [Litorimonas cladophorae]
MSMRSATLHLVYAQFIAVICVSIAYLSSMTRSAVKTPADQSLVRESGYEGRGLSFIAEEAPENGSATEVAPGVFWLRFPLPMRGLNHINLWALKDGDGWVVVDTGIGDKVSRKIWEKHFVDLLGGRPVNRVICTHLHPDHTGLAGWLCRKFGAPLLMTRGEYFLCRLMAADTGKAAPEEGIRFYRKCGFTDDQIELYKMRFGGFGKAIAPLPQSYDRLVSGEIGMIGGNEWRIIIGSGHSPEHACLYSESLNVALTGDQLLPNISSNVSVWPTEPEGNPLEDWISSCHLLIAELPEDVLVCPAHGIPFRGAHKRLAKLIEHHEKALDRLAEHCREPRLATGVYSALFRRKIDDSNRIMAVGESVAHLNCLKNRGVISRRLNDRGQFTYKTRTGWTGKASA